MKSTEKIMLKKLPKKVSVDHIVDWLGEIGRDEELLRAFYGDKTMNKQWKLINDKEIVETYKNLAEKHQNEEKFDKNSLEIITNSKILNKIVFLDRKFADLSQKGEKNAKDWRKIEENSRKNNTEMINLMMEVTNG